MVLVADARASVPVGDASDQPIVIVDPPRRLPRSVAGLLHATAALIWAGTFALYVRVWLAPQDASGSLLSSATDVVRGRAYAPFQYRILVPHALVWLHDHLGWPVGYGETVIDLFLLAIGVTATHALLRKLDLEVWLIPVAGYGAFVGVGMLWWGKFETITAFGAMALATWAVLCDDRRRWLPLGAAALVLAGTRTDLLLALGVALVARWFFAGRRRRDLVGGLATGAFGVAATVALALRYSDAQYDPNAKAIQIVHNLQPLVLLIAVAFALPAVGPYLLARSQPAIRRVVDQDRSTMVPLLAIVAVELGSILVVGRADEVRLLFPITTALGILAVVGWRAILAPYASPAPGMGAGSEGL